MYIQTDNENNIIQLITVGGMPSTNGYEVDSIPEDVVSDLFNYKYIDGEFVHNDDPYVVPEETIVKIKETKIENLSQICRQLIIGGFDHTDGHHYSLSEADQLSLQNLAISAQMGNTTSWHYDDGQCQFYTPEEMLALTGYAAQFITYHRTYFNQLKDQVKNMTDVNEIIATTYGMKLDEAHSSTLKLHTGGFELQIQPVADDYDYDTLMGKRDPKDALSCLKYIG